jgi:hypothetical protein
MQRHMTTMLALLALCILLAASTTTATTPLSFAEFEPTARTGDLVFWHYDSTEGATHRGAGMLVHVKSIDTLMLWEPVVYDAARVATPHADYEGEVHNGGTVRLIEFAAAMQHAAATVMTEGDALKPRVHVTVRPLRHPGHSTDADAAAFTAAVDEAIKQHWRVVESMPPNSHLGAHGA